MHSLFECISNLLSDLCHFVAAFDGEGISVGFHIIEEHECLVQEFVSCGLVPRYPPRDSRARQSMSILESRFSSSSIPAIAFITSSMVAIAVEGVRTYVLIVEFLNLLTSHLHLFLFEHSFECRL